MGVALALAERGRGRTCPNPAVGCVIVADTILVGRGWTQAGGRPHAEAIALAQAGSKSRGATCYTTLEPCAHISPRGPACADLIVAAGLARVVIAAADPDPRTNGAGARRIADAGIAITSGVRTPEAVRTMAGFLTRQRLGRPHVTLKLALSLDGAMAMADGRSRWITGPTARAHAHLERARHEAILIGRGTLETDAPVLDVRLPGLGARNPKRLVLRSLHSEPDGTFMAESASPMPGPDDLITVLRPEDIAGLSEVDHLLVEGGAQAAAAFLAADLIDRLMLYRAPILVGGGRSLPGIGLDDLSQAHGRWRLHDARQLGSDRLEVYERVRG